MTAVRRAALFPAARPARSPTVYRQGAAMTPHDLFDAAVRSATHHATAARLRAIAKLASDRDAAHTCLSRAEIAAEQARWWRERLRHGLHQRREIAAPTESVEPDDEASSGSDCVFARDRAQTASAGAIPLSLPVADVEFLRYCLHNAGSRWQSAIADADAGVTPPQQPPRAEPGRLSVAPSPAGYRAARRLLSDELDRVQRLAALLDQHLDEQDTDSYGDQT